MQQYGENIVGFSRGIDLTRTSVIAGVSLLVLATACTPDSPSPTPTTAAPAPAVESFTPDKKTASCNLMRSEKRRLEARYRALTTVSTAGAVVPALILTAVLGGGMAGVYGQSRTTDALKVKEEIAELDQKIQTQDCHPKNTNALDPSAEVRAQTDGVYQGRGKTASWCQTPTVQLTMDRGRLLGSLWERTDGKPTSDVVGNLTPDGILQMQFDGIDKAYYTGDIDADYKDGVISFVLEADRRCTYTFVLKKGVTDGPLPQDTGVPSIKGRKIR